VKNAGKNGNHQDKEVINMPAGDRTGSWGLGPRTGRGLGYCSGYQAPGFMYPRPGLVLGRGFGLARGFGRGLGRGFRIGRGRGYWWSRFGGFLGYPFYPVTAFRFQPGHEEETAWLADQAKNLEQQLLQVQKRLAELEKDKETEK
jgi:Family of unknown function (DUF5320)